jgi:hypothetical protein
MKERGLPITVFLVFENGDIAKLRELLGQDSYLLPKKPFEAIHIPEIDIVIVQRDRENEKTNGSTYTEGILTHELSHGVNQCSQYLKRDNTIESSRSGFAFRLNKDFPWGWFLEEGFADMIRGEYIEQNITDETSKKLNNIISKLGFDPETFFSLTAETESGLKFELVRKYYVITQQQIGNASSSIAATGLEMLCEKETKLRQTLIEARTNIEKLREIPKLINAIKPGLYMEIQKCGYSEDEFARVQNIIKEAIQNSK